MLNLTAILHQLQQLARTQINSPPSLCLSLLSIDVALDLQRQLRRRKGVARRRHCGISVRSVAFRMSESATGRRILGEIEETSLDEVRTTSPFYVGCVEIQDCSVHVVGPQILIGDKRPPPILTI